MIKYYFFSLFFLFSFCLQAQESLWVAFWNADTTLVGYKDANGQVKIQPKYAGHTAAAYFEHIMAVTESKGESWLHYYVTKSGHTLGQDSLYIFDNAADCESEGFIRFRDKKTDLAGMFNRNGQIVIPAVYNDLSRVNNGLVISLKNAVKEVFEGGEHYAYRGGQVALIDTANHILLDSFSNDENLNLFSLEVSSKPSTNPLRVNFKASDGRYYSFIHFDREFQAWLKTALLNDLSMSNLMKKTAVDIAYWNDKRGWISEKSSGFFSRNYTILKKRFSILKKHENEYDILSDGLNPYIFNTLAYKKYYNHCGESMDARYPMRTISVSNPERPDLTPDQFEFLRTDQGYKLISVSLGEGGLR